ncbi:uncharacterized protein [Nicotiana tomentosiformis]|uniref:uncharacterized protein n=1 Tax=Nicotiana tomentosiformis TaxID=4098 RepID=UPI00388C86EE
MAFKDIPEARKLMKLYALANKKVLKLRKSEPMRVRYRCIVGYPFVCLISKDGNARGKLQDNPKYKVREMVLDLKKIFELNVSHEKCKRAKRIILETLDGSFADEYNKLDAYAIELRRGLIEAIKTVLPQAHHRVYFKDQLSKLGELNKDATKSLLKYPPQSWCRAYLDTFCKNQSVDNNLTESFNSWILEARQKPIIKMLEDIRLKVMNMITKHEVEASTWSNEFSPKSLELYNEFMEITQMCKVNSNGEGGYKVSEGSDKHCVNLSIKKCTCRAWDLTGIPCPHAIRVILHNRGDPLTEMHWWYIKEAFLLTYRYKLQPVRGEKFWKIDPSQAMEPPELVKLAGWPKVKRDRQKDEAVKRQGVWSQSRKGRVMTCDKCGQPNHNARTCAQQPKGNQLSKGK